MSLLILYLILILALNSTSLISNTVRVFVWKIDQPYDA